MEEVDFFYSNAEFGTPYSSKRNQPIKQKENKNMWTDCGADPNSDMVSMDVSERFWLHRDCGAKIFEMIQEQESNLLISESSVQEKMQEETQEDKLKKIKNKFKNMI